MSEWQEKGVSNNGFFRAISNTLDCIPFFKDSSIRAEIHGHYHTIVGIGKFLAGNGEGAAAELGRAGQQYTKAILRSPGIYGD